jgi:serine protease
MNHSKLLETIFPLGTALLIAGTALAAEPLSGSLPSPRPAVPDRFVVRLAPGVRAARLENGFRVERRFGLRDDLAVVSPPEGAPRADALARIRRSPDVLAASPDWPVKGASSEVPDDPYYSWQWSDTLLRWKDLRPILPPFAGTVSVGLLDTGVAWQEMIDPRTGVFRLPAPDLHRVRWIEGWDFVDGDPYPLDENQHGTQMAEIVAAAVSNGRGIAGLIDGLALCPIRVLDAEGRGTLAELIAGLDFAAARRLDVVNLSLTVDGDGEMDALADALDRLIAAGTVVVAAAGNDGGRVAWPAAHPPVLAVGAVRFNGCSDNLEASAKIPLYSAWGPRLDLLAPGGDNAMDMDHDGYPDGLPAETFDPADPNAFGVWLGAGTSFAAAHVTAAAAMLRLWHVPPAAIPELLRASAADLGRPGFDVQSGAGLLDPLAAAALAIAGNWPEPPSYEVRVALHAKGNRTEAEIAVLESGQPAAGVTVYGHWGTADAAEYDSGVSDARGELTLRSAAGSGPGVPFEMDEAVVGGAGFIGSITPAARSDRSLRAVKLTAVELSGHEPACGGRD